MKKNQPKDKILTCEKRKPITLHKSTIRRLVVATGVRAGKGGCTNIGSGCF